MNKIKYLIMDIDGSLTDGKIYMGNDGELMKAFSVKDGYAISYILNPNEIKPIVITGRKSKIVEKRCSELGIIDLYQGITDKKTLLLDLIEKESLKECAYFGDDVLDLSSMKLIKAAGGLVGCPSDAVEDVKSFANYICKNKAGEGAFREFSEWLVEKSINIKDVDDKIKYVIDYIFKLDFSSLQIEKRYQVNDDFYYFVTEYETKDRSECLLESHRKYVDIQYIIEGSEMLETADTSNLILKNEYSDSDDIMFWYPINDMAKMILREGSVIVFYPNNAHMGCISFNGINNVKKLVCKLKI